MLVSNGKPPLSELTSNGFLCADMHSHSVFSDGGAAVDRMLNKAAKNGFYFALTDHNTIKGAMYAQRLRNCNHIIPGMEVSSSEGVHLLVYAERLSELSRFYADTVHRQRRVDPFSRTNKSLLELAEDASEVNALTSIAHPFGHLWTNVSKYIASGKEIPVGIRAIEVLNGEQTKISNKQASEFAKKSGYRATGGSDAHTLHELGRVLTCAQAESVGDFFEQVRLGKCQIWGKEIAIPQRFMPHTNSLRVHARFASTFLQYKWVTKIRPSIDKLKIGRKKE